MLISSVTLGNDRIDPLRRDTNSVVQLNNPRESHPSSSVPLAASSQLGVGNTNLRKHPRRFRSERRSETEMEMEKEGEKREKRSKKRREEKMEKDRVRASNEK